MTTLADILAAGGGVLQPVVVNGAVRWGIGADVLTEALPPHGILRYVFGSLPNELAATVLVIPWADFVALLPVLVEGAVS